MRGLGAHVPSPFILHVVYVVLRCKRSLFLLSVSSLCMLLIDAHLSSYISVLLNLSLAVIRLSFLPSLHRGDVNERLSKKGEIPCNCQTLSRLLQPQILFYYRTLDKKISSPRHAHPSPRSNFSRR